MGCQQKCGEYFSPSALKRETHHADSTKFYGKNAEIYTLDSFNISNIVTRFWVFIFYTLTTPINGTLKIPHLVFFEPFLAIDL